MPVGHSKGIPVRRKLRPPTVREGPTTNGAAPAGGPNWGIGTTHGLGRIGDRSMGPGPIKSARRPPHRVE